MSDLDDTFRAAELLSPDDRLRLISRLWASLPPEHWAAPSPAELAEVERRLAEHAAGRSADVPWEIVNRMLVNHEVARRGKIYSAPRRFDLATIFAVTTAYSLLLAAMAAFQLPPEGIAIAAGFITIVGAGQALLFRGEKPRLASVLVGILCYMIPMVGVALMGPRMMPDGMLFAMLVNGIIGGAVFGYVSGVLVGGVFLIAAAVRRRFFHTTDDEAGTSTTAAPNLPPHSLDNPPSPKP